MVDRHLLIEKIAAIRDRLARIRECLPGSLDEFRFSRDAQELVSFNLFVAFQDALDLAAHVIADSRWTLPRTAREHFEILLQHQILSAECAGAMARCAGLRNLIAHAYGGLDLERLYGELPAGQSALEQFCTEMTVLEA